jgi:multidrug transporter EmrE-like cation transporter
MSPENRKLRRILLIICIAVYLAGMTVVIEVARWSPLGAITDVRYALCAYCGIIVTCIASMVFFSRRVEIESPERR